MGERCIAVVGAGAIGSCLAADLTQDGLEPLAVDQWPAHVEAMRGPGLRIERPDGDQHVVIDALHVCDLAARRPRIDVVILAAKSYDTRWMVELVAPYLAPDGYVIGAQNSLNDETIGSIVGAARVVGCVVELSAETYTPGLVQRDTPKERTWFGVGEHDGTATARVEEAAALLGRSAKVTITDNIVGAKWTKLVVNSMTMGPFGLLGLKNWEAAAIPGMFELSVAIGRESIAVGEALGYEPTPIFGMSPQEFAGSSDETIVKTMRTLLGHIGKASTTAVVQDHLKGRLSEAEYITGMVVRRGLETGVPTPYNSAILEIARRINRRELEMDPAHADLIRELAGHGK